ncbi:hypothetical protein AURDEDRAFT_77528, partial [Auricularia subglabra TFB-10046 SS5]
RSVDNIRIERLWVDVARNLVDKWSSFFRDLETYDQLDAGKPAHVWLLHHLFLEVINNELYTWADHWNNHPMDISAADRQISARTRESPLSMYHYGHLRNGVRGYDIISEPEAIAERDLADYGVDHEALRDQEILRSNRRNNPDAEQPPHVGPGRPARFSVVEVPPPNCPLTATQLSDLFSFVSARTDLQSPQPPVRRHWWILSLQHCQLILPDRF